MKKRAKADNKYKMKTAKGNLEQVYSEYPDARELLSMQFKDDYLPDPTEKETGQAARTVGKKTST